MINKATKKSKSLMRINKEKQLKKIVDIIRHRYQPEKIILFGSYAYGTPGEASDLDLLIIKDTEMPRYKRSREIRKWLWGISDIPKDILVYTNKEIDEWKNVEQAFITEIVRKGKILYENQNRIDKKLD